ncbi:MAG: copper amine oxidase N-terminal domain-containing protein [Candidatus Eremiobacteraeota bacterium]|nr:copper amine oxidase N-terminal domain-containing protein [Candidatus Eremiobacteraeota bacterium]
MRFTTAVVTAALVPYLAASPGAQAGDFGSAPSGRVPILFNDRHVYAKPDELRRGRLLAGIVRGDTFFVPLRSMFEEAGATVEYRRATKTMIVRARGTTVEVTVGLSQVRINGDVRPLDVPPEVHDGVVLVPVRVLAEGLGAYVEYEPSIRAVVIRYVATPPFEPGRTVGGQSATAAPSLARPRPTVPPGPPIPKDTPPPETYVAGDIAIAPRVSNAFSPNESGSTGQSYDVHGAAEYSLFDVPLVLDGEYAKYAYQHPAGAVTVLRGHGATFVPAFQGRDTDVNVHVGTQISPAKVYVAIGYTSLGNDYGYPRIGGLGLGIEKLPYLNKPLSYDASIFYYPNVSGASGPDTLSYSLLTYSGGLTYSFGPIFIEGGYRGDRGFKKSAPVSITHGGPFAGLGFHL